MLRCISLVLTFAVATVACAQDTGTTTADNPADKTPFENNAPGAVQERSPGTIVQAALAKHTAMNNERLARQRSGLPQESGTSGTSSGSSTGTTLTSTISDLLGSGLLGDLGGSLGGLLGGAGGSTTNPNIPSNLTPEVLALLASAGIDINDVFPADGSTASSAVRESDTKSDARSQTTTPDEPKFKIRWANAMLDTLFTSLVFAFQTPTFIDFLASRLEPILFEPPADESTQKAVAPAEAPQEASPRVRVQSDAKPATLVSHALR